MAAFELADLLIAIVTSALFLTLVALSQLWFYTKETCRNVELLNLYQLSIDSGLPADRIPFKNVDLPKSVELVREEITYLHKEMRKNVFEVRAAMVILSASLVAIYFLVGTEPLVYAALILIVLGLLVSLICVWWFQLRTREALLPHILMGQSPSVLGGETNMLTTLYHKLKQQKTRVAIVSGFLILAAAVSVVILRYSQDWTTQLTDLLIAWSSIAVALTATMALLDNRKVLAEMREEGRVRHINKQLAKLYSPFLRNKDIVKRDPIAWNVGGNFDWDTYHAFFAELRAHAYLAGPRFKPHLIDLLKRNDDYNGTSEESKKGYSDAITRALNAAEGEYNELLSELDTMVAPKP